MRKALIGLILGATAITPVAAQAQDGDRRQRAMERYERIERQNQERYGRSEQRSTEAAPQRAERVREAAPEPVQQQAQRSDRGERQQGQWQGRGERGGDWNRRQGAQQEQARQQEQIRQEQVRQEQVRQQQQQQQAQRQWQGDLRDPRQREARDRYERLERQNQQRYGQGGQYQRDRQAQQRQQQRHWDRGWRYQPTYDWQRYRYANRNLFRVPAYYAPYRNHRYTRFSIGLFLGAPLFHQRYWISDPWQYRLPYAPHGYQWVRYYNDVILVDTWTGEVVDVIYDFFW